MMLLGDIMDNLESNLLPSQFSIFKGKSAMRMQLQAPKTIQDKYKVGCVVLQLAPFKEEKNQVRIYSWEDLKLTIKMGVKDLTKVIYAFDSVGEVKLFHEFNGTTKSIELKLNGDKGWFLSVLQNSQDGTKQNISIPITIEEGYAISIMLKHALPIVHNWI